MGLKMTIVPGSKFNQQLRDGALQAMRTKLKLCVQSWGPQIKKDLGDFLKHVFMDTDVARSLRGMGSVDLAAHFGMSDDESLALCEAMGSVIERSVEVGVFKGDALRVGVRAIRDDWEAFMRLPLASHLSSGGYEIPVMRWMLVDPYVDWADAVYGIIFKDGGDIGGRSHSFVKSCSGDAIMVRAGGRVGPWVVPHICGGGAGGNFIEYTLGQPGIARQCIEFVLNVMQGWRG